MSRALKCLLSLSLAIVIAAPLLAAEGKKERRVARKPDPAAAVLKRLEKANLTDEQVAKVKELVAQNSEKIAAAQAKVALTQDQKAARAAAMKKAKEEGKTGKEAAEAARAALALTPEQEKAMEQAKAAQKQMMDAILGLLTPEQKEAAGMKGPAKKGAKKEGGRKGKKAQTESAS